MCDLTEKLVPGVISEIIIRHPLSVCYNGVQRLENQIYLGQEGTGEKFKSRRGRECFESMEEEGWNQEGRNHRGNRDVAMLRSEKGSERMGEDAAEKFTQCRTSGDKMNAGEKVEVGEAKR